MPGVGIVSAELTGNQQVGSDLLSVGSTDNFDPDPAGIAEVVEPDRRLLDGHGHAAGRSTKFGTV
jgi:hypothetical protein